MPINPDEGGGPWNREAPALAPGETWQVNLARETHNGQERWFTPYLPMDEIKAFNNDSSNPVTLTVNGRYDTPVLSDTIEPFSDQGIRYFAVKNEGSTTIAAGDIKVSFLKAPWNADKEARAKHNTPWPGRALNDLIPGGLW